VCTQTLKQNAVPKFRQEKHGEGIANTVDAVASRLRESDKGLSSVTKSFDLRIICPSVVAFGSYASYYYEWRYPLNIDCPKCGAYLEVCRLVDRSQICDGCPGGAEDQALYPSRVFNLVHCG
jgi:hypothetical protein